MGEAHPHLVLTHPELASRPFPWPPRSDAFAPDRSNPGDRLRVGLAASCLLSGGSEQWMLSLARSVNRDRITWRGLALNDGSPIDPAMRSQFETIMPVGLGRTSQKILSTECDVLVAWGVHDLASLVKDLRLPPKTVSVCHAPPEASWARAEYAGSQPDRFVAVSELVLPAISEAATVDVIWNAVDESRLIQSRSWEQMRAKWGVPPGCKVAGFYQRLTEEKDPYAAVRLAESLGPDWRVVVVGYGWMQDDLVKTKTEKGLDRLIFAGADPDAGSVLRAFDCLVCASDYESFGLTMAEALWCGVPIVSTEVGIARLVPGISRLIPFKADGPRLANAVVETAGSPTSPGPRNATENVQLSIRPRLSTARFGAEWTDFLCGLTVPLAVRRQRVIACPHRGPEGGLVLLEHEQSCCGGGAERTACGLNRYEGRPRLRDCLACGHAGGQDPATGHLLDLL
jgi:glycosyltransferase involved in cell wall biosynthesis